MIPQMRSANQGASLPKSTQRQYENAQELTVAYKANTDACKTRMYRMTKPPIDRLLIAITLRKGVIPQGGFEPLRLRWDAVPALT